MQITIKDSKEGKYEIEIVFRIEEEKENTKKAKTFDALQSNEKVVEKTKGFYISSEDSDKVLAILIGILNAMGVLKTEKDFIDINFKDKESKSRIGEYYKKFWVCYKPKQKSNQ